MRILDKYIGKQVLKTILVVLLALLVLDLFFYIINEVRYIGRGDYNFSTVLTFVAFTIPRKIYILFPWAVLIGTLLSLGNLAEQSEIIIMRTSAMSLISISTMVLKAVALLVIAVTLMGELVVPYSESLAQKIKARAINQGKVLSTNKGVWIKNNDNFLYVENIYSKNKLDGITKYEMYKGKMQSIQHAKEANLENKNWQLQNITGTKFNEDSLTLIAKNAEEVKDFLDIEVLTTKLVKHLDRVSLKKLLHVINSNVSNDLNIKGYQLAFWKKVTYPLTCLVMVIVAIPFVFGPLRQTSYGVKLLTGIILGFFFHLVNMIFAPLVMVYNVPVFLAVLTPIFLFLSVSLYMLRIS